MRKLMRQKWSILKCLVVLILVGFVAMTVSRPRPAKLVIREVGVGGERVRNYQVEQDDLDDLSQEELGVRARAILGRKPTALESDKGPANVRNSSETQASPSVPVKTEEKSPMTDEKSPVTDEKSPVPVSTDGEIRASEEKPSIVAEEEELVENTYSKFKVKVVSGRYLAEVHVNDKVVYSSGSDVKQRGLHVVVLNQGNGALLSSQIFDTYLQGGEKKMADFINSVTNGRILCFAIKDEATFHLQHVGKAALAALGSKLAESLTWRDMWVFITKKGELFSEEERRQAPDVRSWAADVVLSIVVQGTDPAPVCTWAKQPENKLRKKYCLDHEGSVLCSCNLRSQRKTNTVAMTNLVGVPVVVLSSSGHQPLIQTLSKLLAAPGANPSSVLVVASEWSKEMEVVGELFGVVIHNASETEKKPTLAQLYGSAVTTVFKAFPEAEFAVVMDDTLNVSPDFFNYFDLTLPLLKQDLSLYCISAWNYQGYHYSTASNLALYREKTPPGLAWMLRRTDFEETYLPKWPSEDKQLLTWETWMANGSLAHERECIVPEVSRVAPFQESELLKSTGVPYKYFDGHALTEQAGVKLSNLKRMTAQSYEDDVISLLKKSRPVDHTLLPTDPNFIPFRGGQVYSVFLAQDTSDDFDTWLTFATLFRFWDLDPRGFHNNLWRLQLRGSHVLVVGCPYSVFCKFMPEGIAPVKLRKLRT